MRSCKEKSSNKPLRNDLICLVGIVVVGTMTAKMLTATKHR